MAEKETNLRVIEADALPAQLDIFEPDPVVRPEYNIGKFAGHIFASPYSKDLDKPRNHQWRVKMGADGEEDVTASLSITPQYGRKTPTTTTLRVYLALLQIWTREGQPADGVVMFSARQLCEVIGWKWAGSDTARRIAEHISVLQSTGINWDWAYKNAEGATMRTVSDMNILASAEYNERKKLLKKEKFSALQRVRFNPDLVENMLKGHVRPLNYNAIRSVRNDASLNLYTKLDIYLARKTKWERRSYELFREELNLEGKMWEKRTRRFAKLKELVSTLDGTELLSGRLRLSIEKTKDGKDYKLVARKEAIRKPKDRSHIRPIIGRGEATAIAEKVIEDIKKLPRGGSPRESYIIFLCRHYPIDFIYEALSKAKADYSQQVKTKVVNIFCYELESIVRESRDFTWHKDVPKAKTS